MLLLCLFDIVRVLLLCNVGAIDDDDFAAFFDMEAELFKVLLCVEVLQLVVESQYYSRFARKLSRHCGLTRAWKPSDDIAELKPGRAESRVRSLLFS